jgi:hypothetical protein
LQNDSFHTFRTGPSFHSRALALALERTISAAPLVSRNRSRETPSAAAAMQAPTPASGCANGHLEWENQSAPRVGAWPAARFLGGFVWGVSDESRGRGRGASRRRKEETRKGSSRACET